MVLDSTGRIYYGTIIFAVDSQYVMRLNPATNVKDTLFRMPNRIAGLEIGNMDSVLYYTQGSNLFKYNFANQTIRSLNNGFEYPTVLRLRRKTNELFSIEVGGDNGRAAILAKYDVITGARTKVAGGLPGVSNQEVGYVNGNGDAVRFRFISPNGPFKNGGALAFSPDEDTLYIGDANNRCIRKLNLITGEVSTFAGPLPDSVRVGFQDGFRFDARFNTINGIAVDKAGFLYVADNGPFSQDTTTGNRIRKISPAGLVKTLLGSGIGRGTNNFDNLDFTPGLNGKDAKIGNLNDVAFDKNKDTLYINQLQRITKAQKRNSSLRFSNLQNRTVGSGKYAIVTLSNSAVPKTISFLSSPANVTFLNDTVNVPTDAETGLVVLRAEQQEDLDSIYRTIVIDSFRVIIRVSNLILSENQPVRLYPNPSENGIFYLNVADDLLAELNLAVYDLLGRNVPFKLTDDLGKAKRVTITNKPGVYMVALKVGNAAPMLQKLIIR